MTPDWLKKKKEIPSVVLSLKNDALATGSWIYQKSTRRFYTPEEFMENWERIYQQSPRGKNNREDFQIMNPMAAVRQRSLWVAKANAELQDVMKKLEAYQAQFKSR